MKVYTVHIEIEYDVPAASAEEAERRVRDNFTYGMEGANPTAAVFECFCNEEDAYDDEEEGL